MTVEFDIHFHGPFRVATGRADRGMDSVGDDDVPLPAASLKGLMLAEARRFFDDALVNAIFGSVGGAGVWAWTDAVFETPPRRVPRSRIAIDPTTNTVTGGALQSGEQLWADRATFAVEPVAPINAECMAEHRAVLACAAGGVHALGAERRRGMGWVDIATRVDHAALVEAGIKLRGSKGRAA